jgi:hypothetical protein
MSNRNYANGRDREYQAMRYLEKWGYVCVRAAGSHGLWDVIGRNRDRFVLAQVKYNCKPSAAELREMVDDPVPRGTIKMVLIYRFRKEVEVVYL